ncbi:hypothetical protein D0N36_17625 [Hymenobacter lapidiphilus]|uniref:hypothetical protein n=1 Tax=Hymenobacter sp. CCM 8763 TaxID=2303334 RepID=UPI000E3549D3|nr:hypothetical protein [Hymenobacter sp. CCM 8763]RFP63754.1 hypothetical protein D0N36_17625 [Hymenobacter sp. CCM 8763]
MKKPCHIPTALLLLALLAACTSCGSEAEPKVVATAFGKDFDLHYRQSATMPSVASPELTVLVEDLQFSICPSNARCSVPDHVLPTLAISGHDGQTQLLKLPSSGRLIVNSEYPDTTSVRANGRRYVVHYTSWKLAANKQDNPAKQDFTISLRVEKT